MNESLSQVEKDLMLELFGKIVTLKELDDWMKWWEQQCELERETQRSFMY